MILKSFKVKSNKKYLNKLLSKRQLLANNNKIESLAVVVNLDEIEKFDVFYDLGNLLKIQPNKLKVIGFSTKKNQTNSNVFNLKDFGWKDTIKNIELHTFLETDFDALISYYSSNLLELKLLTAKSKAKFKIGILPDDNRLNDLIIKTKINEFNVFKDEVFKYLTILNKIKNE